MNESKISAILGGLVIVIVGIMVVNYFRNLKPGDTTPPGITTEQLSTPSTEQKHTVAQGESLWSIAQKYYNDGNKWTEIRDANSLGANVGINAGQELIIPNASGSATIAEASPTSLASPSASTTPASPAAIASVKPSPTLSATVSPTPKAEDNKIAEPEAPSTITGETYTVVKGDTLWDIAQRAYGDPYKWVEIAQANKLVNPDLIHPGNVFTLPR